MTDVIDFIPSETITSESEEGSPNERKVSEIKRDLHRNFTSKTIRANSVIEDHERSQKSISDITKDLMEQHENWTRRVSKQDLEEIQMLSLSTKSLRDEYMEKHHYNSDKIVIGLNQWNSVIEDNERSQKSIIDMITTLRQQHELWTTKVAHYDLEEAKTISVSISNITKKLLDQHNQWSKRVSLQDIDEIKELSVSISEIITTLMDEHKNWTKRIVNHDREEAVAMSVFISGITKRLIEQHEQWSLTVTKKCQDESISLGESIESLKEAYRVNGTEDYLVNDLDNLQYERMRRRGQSVSSKSAIRNEYLEQQKLQSKKGYLNADAEEAKSLRLCTQSIKSAYLSNSNRSPIKSSVNRNEEFKTLTLTRSVKDMKAEFKGNSKVEPELVFQEKLRASLPLSTYTPPFLNHVNYRRKIEMMSEWSKAMKVENGKIYYCSESAKKLIDEFQITEEELNNDLLVDWTKDMSEVREKFERGEDTMSPMKPEDVQSYQPIVNQSYIDQDTKANKSTVIDANAVNNHDRDENPRDDDDNNDDMFSEQSDYYSVDERRFYEDEDFEAYNNRFRRNSVKQVEKEPKRESFSSMMMRSMSCMLSFTPPSSEIKPKRRRRPSRSLRAARYINESLNMTDDLDSMFSSLANVTDERVSFEDSIT